MRRSGGGGEGRFGEDDLRREDRRRRRSIEPKTTDGHPLATVFGLWGASEAFFYEPTLLDLVTGDVYQGKAPKGGGGGGPQAFFGPIEPPADARLTGSFSPAQLDELSAEIRSRIHP